MNPDFWIKFKEFASSLNSTLPGEKGYVLELSLEDVNPQAFTSNSEALIATAEALKKEGFYVSADTVESPLEEGASCKKRIQLTLSPREDEESAL